MGSLSEIAPLFGKSLSNFGLALLPVRQERTKPAAWAAPLQSWRIAAVAETGGEDRSTEIAPEIFKRAGISRALDDLAYGVGNASSSPLRIDRDHRFASTFSKFLGKSGASGAHKKNDPHYLSESKCKQATAFQD